MFPLVQSQIKQREGLIAHSSLSHMAILNNNIRRDSASVPTPPPPPPPSLLSPPPSSSSGKISPAVLFIIVILAIVFFISGLLHLLVRFFMKHRSTPSFSHSSRFLENSSSDTYQRQLQQLFTLHDSGLDQAFIDALPVFQYEEIVGSKKEQFDCAVCLCEFSDQDKLRLLPLCSHAFHIDCIDTWLLSNSTCPICRGALHTPGLPIENPVFDFDDSREEDDGSGLSIIAGVGSSGRVSTVVGQKPSDPDSTGDQRRVFPVRLGKFRSTNEGQAVEAEVGETSSSNLDARRCFSMGSYQYVVAESELQVAVCSQRTSNGGDLRMVKERGGHSSIDRDNEGKRINIGSKNESFSVSKVWLWRNKGKFPNSSNVHMGGDNSSIAMKLPWTNNNRPFGT